MILGAPHCLAGALQSVTLVYGSLIEYVFLSINERPMRVYDIYGRELLKKIRQVTYPFVEYTIAIGIIRSK